MKRNHFLFFMFWVLIFSGCSVEQPLPNTFIEVTINNQNFRAEGYKYKGEKKGVYCNCNLASTQGCNLFGKIHDENTSFSLTIPSKTGISSVASYTLFNDSTIRENIVFAQNGTGAYANEPSDLYEIISNDIVINVTSISNNEISGNFSGTVVWKRGATQYTMTLANGKFNNIPILN